MNCDCHWRVSDNDRASSGRGQRGRAISASSWERSTFVTVRGGQSISRKSVGSDSTTVCNCESLIRRRSSWVSQIIVSWTIGNCQSRSSCSCSSHSSVRSLCASTVVVRKADCGIRDSQSRWSEGHNNRTSSSWSQGRSTSSSCSWISSTFETVRGDKGDARVLITMAAR